MKRRVRGPGGGAPSLFPFLAVLICTMGALIVLLVVTVRQAEVQATAIKAELADEVEERQLEAEAFEWQREVLEQSRRKTAERLAQERNRLSHLEDHIRRLRDQIARLSAEAERMESAGLAQGGQAAAAELARVKEQIARAGDALEAARREAAARPRSFAVVPYDGPQGTRRRPIYIECRSDRVILQPEGIELRDGDFRAPLGPDNPLASALRATREYLATAAAAAGQGEPYPLLIVRPDGASAYAAARAAMKSWDTEFGYELIEADARLAFPRPDPSLAETQSRAVAEARRWRQRLAAAAPGRFGRVEGEYAQVAAVGNGFQIVRPRGSENEQGQRSGREGGRDGAGPGGAGPGGAGPGGAGPGGGRGGTQDFAAGREPGSGGTSFAGHAHGQPAAAATPPGAGGRSAAQAEGPGGPMNHPRPGASVPIGFGAAKGSAAGDGGDPAQSRGRNWGLPNTAAGSTGFTRPMRVVCFADRLVLLAEGGDATGATVVPVEGPLAGRIDEFVAALWKRMESWGIAGRRSYWKPVLNVEIAPGGETRFAELAQLLRDSGIDVQRKQP